MGISVTTKGGSKTELGIRATLGSLPPFQAPLSPITMTRDIFRLPP